MTLPPTCSSQYLPNGEHPETQVPSHKSKIVPVEIMNAEYKFRFAQQFSLQARRFHD